MRIAEKCFYVCTKIFLFLITKFGPHTGQDVDTWNIFCNNKELLRVLVFPIKARTCTRKLMAHTVFLKLAKNKGSVMQNLVHLITR